MPSTYSETFNFSRRTAPFAYGAAHRSAAARSVVRAMLDRYRLWRAAARERHALEKLGPRMLADIGVTMIEAHREAKRPFYDVTPRK